MNEMIKAEVVRRFKILEGYYGLLSDVRKMYESGIINKSIDGILFNLDEEEMSLVRKIEAEKGITIYACIHGLTGYGELYSFLYVSKYDDEWERDIEELKNGTCMSYVYNKDVEYCSEFGHIQIQGFGGGLMRIA